MSWGTCYSGSNNIHFNFPATMNDSRIYTNWKSPELFDEKIKKENNITNNNDYRKYLQSNALNIMKYNQLQSCDDCGICPYHISTNNNLTQPFFYSNILENNSPYGYNNSDLKNQYMSRQVLQSRLFTPISIKKTYDN